MTTTPDHRDEVKVSRRAALLGAAAVTAAAVAPSAVLAQPPQRRLIAYVGTYTDRGKGIHIFNVDRETGKLTPLKEVTGVDSPSALALDPTGHCLYAANEVGTFGGQATGSVTAYAIDRSGRFVLVANYANVPPAQLPGASVAALPITPGGSLGTATDVVALPRGPLGPHHGTGSPPGSFADSGHDAPHAHMAVTDPAGRFVLVTDLGTDRIYIYRFDRTAGKLLPNDSPFFQAAPGVGPRHLAFHPWGRFCYSVNEESSTIDFLSYDPERGRLELRQTL
jgi:6-phosphogluconolactonase